MTEAKVCEKCGQPLPEPLCPECRDTGWVGVIEHRDGAGGVKVSSYSQRRCPRGCPDRRRSRLTSARRALAGDPVGDPGALRDAQDAAVRAERERDEALAKLEIATRERNDARGRVCREELARTRELYDVVNGWYRDASAERYYLRDRVVPLLEVERDEARAAAERAERNAHELSVEVRRWAGEAARCREAVEQADRHWQADAECERCACREVRRIVRKAIRSNDGDEWLTEEQAAACELPPDGRMLRREDYPDLYAVIGTQFGGDEGEGTFRLPDLRSAVVTADGQPMESMGITVLPGGLPLGHVRRVWVDRER